MNDEAHDHDPYIRRAPDVTDPHEVARRAVDEAVEELKARSPKWTEAIDLAKARVAQLSRID